jgi:peptidyl-prolyl cis-trans isomerase D
LYALDEVGEVSEPVQTSFGFHIIRLDEIAAERVKDFAEVRDEVERELRLQRAEARFYDATEILTNLSYENPDSLEPAAEALELQIKESEWLNRQGGGSGIAAYPQVLELAFSEEVLDQGLNSEPIEVEPSHVVVIRAESHKEATLRSLDEVRDEIISAIRAERARDALKRAADDLLKQAAEGKALQEIAAESGGELKALGMVERDDPQVDRQILTEAFRLPAPAEGKIAAGATDLGIGRRALVTVSRVVPGKVADLEEDEREALVQRLTSQLGTSEFQAVLSSLRQQTKIVTYRDRL